MTKMIPNEIRPDYFNRCEQIIFDRIKTDFPNNWIAFHSLDLVEQKGTYWSEVDFVIIGPPGIFCIEIKGGIISKSDGAWYSLSHDGKKNPIKNPFEQAKNARFAVRNLMLDNFDKRIVDNILIGYGVVFPDSHSINLKGPDVIPDIVYDKNSGEEKLSVYIKSITQYWTHQFSNQMNKRVDEVNKQLIQKTSNILRPNFDLKVGLGLQVKQIENEIIGLTEEQYELLDQFDLSLNPRMLVNGRAGTGKTLCAVDLAKKQAKLNKKVLFVCYNKRLSTFLANTLTKYDTNIEVYYFHGMMETIVRNGRYKTQMLNQKQDDVYYERILPNICIDTLLEDEHSSKYDVLIVDEGQDLLRDPYLDILDMLIQNGLSEGSWSIFYDPVQDIYDSIEKSALDLLLSKKPFQHRLRKNCRNTRQIAMTTKVLSGYDPAPTLQIDGIDTQFLWFNSANEQTRNISKIINKWLSEEGITNKDIVVISPKRLANSALNTGLDKKLVPFPLVEWDKEELPPEKAIAFSTIHSFKGLESNLVIVADIEELQNPQKPQLSNLFDVACSRAKSSLVISVSMKLKDELEKRIMKIK